MVRIKFNESFRGKNIEAKRNQPNLCVEITGKNQWKI